MGCTCSLKPPSLKPTPPPPLSKRSDRPRCSFFLGSAFPEEESQFFFFFVGLSNFFIFWRRGSHFHPLPYFQRFHLSNNHASPIFFLDEETAPQPRHFSFFLKVFFPWTVKVGFFLAAAFSRKATAVQQGPSLPDPNRLVLSSFFFPLLDARRPSRGLSFNKGHVPLTYSRTSCFAFFCSPPFFPPPNSVPSSLLFFTHLLSFTSSFFFFFSPLSDRFFTVSRSRRPLLPFPSPADLLFSRSVFLFFLNENEGLTCLIPAKGYPASPGQVMAAISSFFLCSEFFFPSPSRRVEKPDRPSSP